MKLSIKPFLTVFAVFACAPFAESQGINESDMQNMMRKTEQAQACFAKLDPSTFKELENKGKAMKQEIDGLCSAGKRGQALKKAMQFAKEFNNLPEFQEMQKCTEIMEGMMGFVDIPDLEREFEREDNLHICDDI